MATTGFNTAFPHRVFGTVLVCLSLGGCMGGSQTVKPDYRFQADERRGLGVVSVEVDDQCGKETPVVHYREAKSGTKKRRELVLDKESKGGVPGFPQGWFFVQEEEPGDYLFTHVSYGSELKAGISRTPVTFSNGKVAYLGALTVSIPDCKQLSVTVADRSERDLPTFERYMKNFKSKYVIKQVINGR